MTSVCIHQPDFVPWLGFFDRLFHVDVFIVLDHVQFIRRGWQHRDRIKVGGEARWLTLPVLKSGRYDQRIDEVELDESQNWRQKHLRSLESAYARAPHAAEAMPAVRAVYERPHRLMVDFNMDFLNLFMEMLKIDVRVYRSSAMACAGSSNELLIGLVKSVGGTSYMTGMGARDYLDEAKFSAAGVEVAWRRFSSPEYPQIGGGPFLPGLSALDALFNLGSAGTRRLLEERRDVV